MRRLVFSAAALLMASAGAAVAAPATISVSVAPKLQQTFHKTYGDREAEWLAANLRRTVERSLARTGALQNARVELVLTDVKPNRPTFKQLGDTPGLSMESFGLGGATVEGRIIAADGRETPVSYRWYETDIREAAGRWVWTDAERSFDNLARRLARGPELAER